MSQYGRYSGRPVSDGVAAGQLYLADAATPPAAAGPAAADPAATTGSAAVTGHAATRTASPTRDEVQAAFAAVAAERTALAQRLRAAGREAEAAIVSVAAVIAADPALAGAAVAAMQAGADAGAAVRQAAADQAAIIAAVPNPELAERAGDVRQIGVAVLEHLGGAAAPPPASAFILVRHEVAAVDLIELADRGLVGAVTAVGGASSHAAIVARGLGTPMITGLDVTPLAKHAGERAILDAVAGLLLVGPSQADLAALEPRRAGQPGPARIAGTAYTRDRRPFTVLANVASAAEVKLGLARGAAGVGLIRTEIPFTGAADWPSEADHLAALTPILDRLDGRIATVRLLDFSGDKAPAFLGQTAGGPLNGLTALLAHPDALRWQLRAALFAGRRAELAICVPMVSSPEEVAAVGDTLDHTAAELGVARPRLGIMVELPPAAIAAGRFAGQVDFFSIGTNDLASQVLGLDRRNQAATPEHAADPRVLTLIDQVATSAHAAGIDVSVCGDAAADDTVLPLLIGLGIRTVSVPAARVARVASWLADWDSGTCATLAAKSVKAGSLDEVKDMVRHARIS